MEDEKIIGLYWERNEDAITETSSKYGKLFFRIASITILGGVTVRADDGLGKDLGVLLRLGPRRQVGRICSRQIHVVIHQRQEVEAV